MTTARRLLELNGEVRAFAEDTPPRAGGRMAALVGARVLDELTGAPPLSALSVSSPTPAHLRVAEGGLVGLAGIPQAHFPALATQPYDVELTITAEGFISRTLGFTVPLDPQFPERFSAPPIADVALARQPVVFEGRVVRAVGGTLTPLPGATVQLVGIWLQPVLANVAVPASAPNLVAISPPLREPRSPATAALQPETLTAVVGADKRLLQDVTPGALGVRVDNHVGLAVGSLIAIDADDPERIEHQRVVSIDGASTAAQPATLTLELPTAFSHRRSVVVRQVTAAPAGAARSLTRAASAGDVVLFPSTTAGLTTGGSAVLTSAPGSEEHVQLSRFEAVCDAGGYYRLPPLSRVAEILVRAQSGALAPLEQHVRPDYTRRRNRLDLILR